MRGEQRNSIFDGAFDKGSPPLARGTDIPIEWMVASIGITPACAGNRRNAVRAIIVAWDHPRLRGEQYRSFDTLMVILGSPPLARGTGTARIQRQGVDRITPACAGNRAGLSSAYHLRQDHPRLRGEQYHGTYIHNAPQGSPPLARGTGFHRFGVLRAYRITPACAGNSRSL